MVGRLLVDLLFDRLKSAGVPQRQGARMHMYDGVADAEELDRLVAVHADLWHDFPYAHADDRLELAAEITCGAFEINGLPSNTPLAVQFAAIVERFILAEPGFQPLELRDRSSPSLLQQAELIRSLRIRIAFLEDDTVRNQFIETLLRLLVELLEKLPSEAITSQPAQQALATTDLLSLLNDPRDFMTAVLSHFLSNEALQKSELFVPLTRQLYCNALEASGVLIDPDRPLLEHDTPRPVFPNDCGKLPLTEVARKYFADTPLLELFNANVSFNLPEASRFEHMHVIAGTGHGKTQTLQHLICADLMRPSAEVPSMVILDSQGDMIDTLKKLSIFDPQRPDSLADRLLIVDPSDVQFAPSLNLFDIQSERLEHYNQRDREQVLAGIIEIYDYIFGGLLGAELTQKQAMVFRFLAQLMLSIPGSTIHTLRDLLLDASPFMDHIAKLPETASGFFETQFFEHGYKATREQILRRLYGVLQNPSFERMFASPHNRLDLFPILNDGGIVLVNTSKDFMKAEASSIFGRYIIALTFKAAMERAILSGHERRPTFLWIDEASEYFDDNIDNLLIQARKFKLGIVMAHQYLGQLSRNLPASLMTNTSIKLAGGVSDRDARVLAPEMRTTPDFLNGMTKERDSANFATFVRNHTPHAIPLTIPFGTAEGMEKMPDESFDILLDASRKRLSPLQVADPDHYSEDTPRDNGAAKEGNEPRSSSAIPHPDQDEIWEEC